jgi:hypothetical protein
MTQEKSKNIRRPGKSADVPEAQAYDPITMQRNTTPKAVYVNQWFKNARELSSQENELNKVLIDPKQAAYARKQPRKKGK